MGLFRYKAFGLNIESGIEIPEFSVSSDSPEVFVHLGEVPESLDNPLFKGVRFEASPGAFLLRVDSIANFYTEAGTRITIQPCRGAAEADIRLFLLGSAFGALIHQRGMLPMHGSSVSFGGKAYIFSGISGVGKSTLAAGFVHRGYELLSDDISVVSLSGQGQPLAYAGYPGVKLWSDSLVKLGMDPEHYARVRSKLNKHHLHVQEQYHPDALPLGGVYVLQTKNSDGLQLDELKGIEKFNALKNNTYRLNFIKGLGNTEAHFRHVSALAAFCKVKRITRTSKSFSLDTLLDLVEKDIKGEERG
jgi:hypothetical protein